MNDENLLVIGYYDRKNIGDEAYKIALPIVFKTAKTIRFVCSDDITEIPSDVTTVICGGGDIINDYFMKKIQELVAKFTGRVYAVSVGIPYVEAVKYLHIFDHVFARSSIDYEAAAKEIGNRNVTLCRDVTECIPVTLVKRRPRSRIRLGLCLAQPYFYQNPNKTRLINSLATVLARLYRERQDIEYHFLTFNYDDSHHECDEIINSLVAKQLSHYHVPYSFHDDLTAPVDMLNFINKFLDVTLCMRYHSVMFSVITNKRFVPLFVSSKIHNLLNDLSYDESFCVEMPSDQQYKPIMISETKLYQALDKACNNLNYQPPASDTTADDIFATILQRRKYADILVKDKLRSFDDVVCSVKRALIKYIHIDISVCTDIVMQKGPLPIGDKDPLDVARFICFIISGKTHHPCVWGLANKLTECDFMLFDSIKFIWETCKTSHEQSESEQTYYPSLNGVDRRVMINLDYVFQNDFSQYHRSGWSYVIGGLMKLDASHIMRTSDVLVDTYVDRSFHWGYPILKYLNMLPYDKPWYGFVHHTFNTDHSEFNCYNLLNNDDFIQSLKCCKGILCLSRYLANQFQDELKKININVPVYSLYHPMEFIDNVFTMDKFRNNPNRKIVQIGAWLRNPYGIYEMPLPSDGGPLRLTKVALKGKEMDQYFPPPGFADAIEDTLIEHDWFSKNINDPCCRDNICRDLICRPAKSHINKFCKGLYDHIMDQLNSVVILDKLSNDDYDNLLAENIVFLNLVDCSAVNTVVECIVRNTPLIINKLPPLVEVLGNDYPGFYTSCNEAADLCQDMNTIKRIHDYLSKLNKDRYKLENFAEDLQDLISTGKQPESYDLYHKPTRAKNVFLAKYLKLQKFLPFKFYA